MRSSFPSMTRKQVPDAWSLILSVDLRSAFDKLTHASMEQALALTEIPEEMQFLIRLWHHNMQYRTQFADQPRSFKAQQGIRQGCKVSPYVWLLFTKLVMMKANETLGSNWCQRIYSAYADDQLIRAELGSPAALEELLHGIGCVLDILEALGMELSPGTSLAVLALTGSRAKKLYRRHTIKVNGRMHLRLPGRSQRLVPLQDSIDYLGCCIGYKHLTADTVLEAANTAFHRLKAVLCCRTVSLAMRVRLWKACVLSNPPHLTCHLTMFMLAPHSRPCMPTTHWNLSRPLLVTFILDPLKLPGNTPWPVKNFSRIAFSVINGAQGKMGLGFIFVNSMLPNGSNGMNVPWKDARSSGGT